MKRKCGSCTLCCTALAVPELGKKTGEPCKHLTPTGCGIYEDRPLSCRAFECMWLQGAGRHETRPDYTGGVLANEDDPETNLGPALVVYSDPNGKDPRRSKWIMRKVARIIREMKGAVVFVRGDQRSLHAHEHNPHMIRIMEIARKEND